MAIVPPLRPPQQKQHLRILKKCPILNGRAAECPLGDWTDMLVRVWQSVIRLDNT